MSANLKTSAVSTPDRKKTHTLALVESKGKKKQGKHDALAPYREQAEKYMRLYFSPSTPSVIRDFYSSLFTRMESDFQIFWNERPVLEAVLPLWLQEADRLGIDIDDEHEPLCLEAMQETITVNKSREEVSYFAERDELMSELERDAEAIARILNSPHVPAIIKDALGARVLELTDDHNEAPEVLRAQWPLAMLKLKQEEGKAQETV